MGQKGDNCWYNLRRCFVSCLCLEKDNMMKYVYCVHRERGLETDLQIYLMHKSSIERSWNTVLRADWHRLTGPVSDGLQGSYFCVPRSDKSRLHQSDRPGSDPGGVPAVQGTAWLVDLWAGIHGRLSRFG